MNLCAAIAQFIISKSKAGIDISLAAPCLEQETRWFDLETKTNLIDIGNLLNQLPPPVPDVALRSSVPVINWQKAEVKLVTVSAEG